MFGQVDSPVFNVSPITISISALLGKAQSLDCTDATEPCDGQEYLPAQGKRIFLMVHDAYRHSHHRTKYSILALIHLECSELAISFACTIAACYN